MRAQDAYRLLALTGPAVAEAEASAATLRAEVASHRETIAEKEALLAQHNPRTFHTLQAGALLGPCQDWLGCPRSAGMPNGPLFCPAWPMIRCGMWAGWPPHAQLMAFVLSHIPA